MLIGELSRRTGVSTRLLRYYGEQGPLTSERGPNGYRTYGEDAALTVRRIRALPAPGLITEVIRSVLPCARGSEPGFGWCADLWGALERESAASDERIGELTCGRDTLAAHLARP
ncbi:MerR family transcriptional regulator [Streptomyces verrucosisporus]|uniref:MerR family transcriptional regulator n=1 Tax=Streptomyces verrucosisporus TaxID=1695161 RepID=UPI0019D1D057|nr:MerR family transcriptional regulator [Streptomyces verrucosisporus]MBN3931880.1 MerR family transcriptional regulator [Streptomyces verrucosisporus]